MHFTASRAPLIVRCVQTEAPFMTTSIWSDVLKDLVLGSNTLDFPWQTDCVDCDEEKRV